MSVSAKQWLLGLRSWKLFMLAVALFFTDLLVPDPLLLVDETLFAFITLLLSQWKRQRA